MASSFPIELGAFIFNAEIEAQIHSVDRVDNIGYPAHSDLCIVVDGKSGELFDRLDQERGAAICV